MHPPARHPRRRQKTLRQPAIAIRKEATVANDRRLSGAQTTARSESDVRFNYNNLTQIIGASNDNGGANQAQFYSSDGGATLKQTNLPAGAGDSFQNDPALDLNADRTAVVRTVRR